MKIKGNNELHLCELTMMEIVQEWLDANTEFGAKVTSVTADSTAYSSIFTIKLTDEVEL